MTPRDRALELFELARQDAAAAHVLEGALGVGDAVIGFHYQQAAEKLLKAVLAERDIDYPLTHDLIRLRVLVYEAGFSLPVEPLALGRLIPFAVPLRYGSMTGREALRHEEAAGVVAALMQWVVDVLHVDEAER